MNSCGDRRGQAECSLGVRRARWMLLVRQQLLRPRLTLSSTTLSGSTGLGPAPLTTCTVLGRYYYTTSLSRPPSIYMRIPTAKRMRKIRRRTRRKKRKRSMKLKQKGVWGYHTRTQLIPLTHTRPVQIEAIPVKLGRFPRASISKESPDPAFLD